MYIKVDDTFIIGGTIAILLVILVFVKKVLAPWTQKFLSWNNFSNDDRKLLKKIDTDNEIIMSALADLHGWYVPHGENPREWEKLAPFYEMLQSTRSELTRQKSKKLRKKRFKDGVGYGKGGGSADPPSVSVLMEEEKRAANDC